MRPGQTVENPVTGERFEVVAGEMRFRVGLRTIIAGPGDVLLVEPGVAHSFANAGPARRRDRRRAGSTARSMTDLDERHRVPLPVVA